MAGGGTPIPDYQEVRRKACMSLFWSYVTLTVGMTVKCENDEYERKCINFDRRYAIQRVTTGEKQSEN